VPGSPGMPVWNGRAGEADQEHSNGRSRFSRSLRTRKAAPRTMMGENATARGTLRTAKSKQRSLPDPLIHMIAVTHVAEAAG
jgi:hypothetical protein